MTSFVVLTDMETQKMPHVVDIARILDREQQYMQTTESIEWNKQRGNARGSKEVKCFV